MNARLWIAKRLRLSGSNGNTLSAGTVIAVCGVAIAVAVMEITLAVVTGFKHQITQKVTGFESGVTVCPPLTFDDAGSDCLRLDSALAAVLKEAAPNHQPVLSLQYPGVLKTDDDFAGVVYLAYDQNRNRTFEQDNMIDGDFPDFASETNINSIVISKSTANVLNLNVGDKVYSCYFANESMKTRRHTIAGIYESNLGEFDKMVVYASLPALQSIVGVDSLTGNRLEYDGMEDDMIDGFAAELRSSLVHAARTGRLEYIYPVTDVHQSGAIYFNWLALLDTNVAVIFILMLCVAGFTLVASLYMVVLDRIPTIGVLRSIGATSNDISSIFLSMGMKLTFVGMLFGNLIGLGICILQTATHVFKLDPEMYYLKYVPIELPLWQIILLNLAVMVVSAAVLYIPSKSASRIDPVETIKQE